MLACVNYREQDFTYIIRFAPVLGQRSGDDEREGDLSLVISLWDNRRPSTRAQFLYPFSQFRRQRLGGFRRLLIAIGSLLLEVSYRCVCRNKLSFHHVPLKDGGRVCLHCLKYPVVQRYSYVAPVSWIVSKHVSKGREMLDFSAWADQSTRRTNAW